MVSIFHIVVSFTLLPHVGPGRLLPTSGSFFSTCRCSPSELQGFSVMCFTLLCVSRVRFATAPCWQVETRLIPFNYCGPILSLPWWLVLLPFVRFLVEEHGRWFQLCMLKVLFMTILYVSTTKIYTWIEMRILKVRIFLLVCVGIISKLIQTT